MTIAEALRAQLTQHQIYDHKQIFTLRGISRYGKIVGQGKNLAIEFEKMDIMSIDGQVQTLPALTVNI